jgi:uncharacterized membrane protein
LSNGSLDILRQSGWDFWTLICFTASAAMIVHAFITRPWQRRNGWISLALPAFGVGGTILVVATPNLHRPAVGLAWTTILMCVLSATFYLHLRPQLGTAKMSVLLTLRLLTVIMLVPMLFEPVWRFGKAETKKTPLTFLIDTSGSMSVPDVPNGPTRIQSIWQTLRPLLPKIEGNFVARFYHFDSACAPMKNPRDLAEISADGRSTDFVAAVNQAASAGDGPMVLISDGNDNVTPHVADSLRQSQRIIHTVTVGSPLSQPANLINVAVDNVAAPQDVGVGQETKILATIKSTALPNRVVDVNLAEVDADGHPTSGITSRRLVLQPVAEGQKIELPYIPRVTGVRTLAVWIDPVPGERILSDNRQIIQLLAVEERIRILYIEGALRPEYKYLNLLLGHDTDVELANLYRLQRDRFAAGGTVSGEPFTGMPQTSDDWKRFDVILIGDLDASFLKASEQAQIAQRVSDGGGLVMIGGLRNFGAGGYQGTPIEQALPVLVGDLSSPQDMDPFVPQLTAEGSAHPIMDGLSDWFPLGDKPAPNAASPLRGNVVVAGAKAGAEILLVHPGKTGPDGRPEIVLAVQHYGKGRSAAFTADTTNVWYRQFREQGQGSLYNRFWGQLLHWAAGRDAQKKRQGAGIDALLNKTLYQFGKSAQVRAVVRDEHGDTTQYAQVNATLSGAGISSPMQFPLTAVEGRGGTYQLVLPPPGAPGLKPGDYSLEVEATKDNASLGRQTLKFTVVPPDEEMLKIASDPKQMEEIAAETGGFSRPLSELPELLDSLIAANAPAPSAAQEKSVPLSNTPRLLLNLLGEDAPWPPHSDLPMEGAIVIVLLAAEWGLRRKWQLP